MKVFANWIDLKIPHHTTISQWIIRLGCQTLQAPLEKANDWTAIGDLTIGQGKLKCLAILGVKMSLLEKRNNLTLSHKDVEVIGLYPTEKSNGKFIEKAYEDAKERIGGNFLANVIDQGADIKKGAILFQQAHPKLKLLHDISHKLSNIMQHELENDKIWSLYIQQLTMTRRRVYQTELAALMPKRQLEKARFIDVGYLVHWASRIKRSKSQGCLNSISEVRYQDYFGWIDSFIISLDQWEAMVSIVNLIKETVRDYGYSRAIYNYLKMILNKAAVKGEPLRNFIVKCLNTVLEEVKKLNRGQTLIGSTEVLESIFGKYKAINEGLQGITGKILGICTFVGREKSGEHICEALEKCSVKKAAEFVKQKFGQTICALKKSFYPRIKKTKFDIEQEVVLYA